MLRMLSGILAILATTHALAGEFNTVLNVGDAAP